MGKLHRRLINPIVALKWFCGVDLNVFMPFYVAIQFITFDSNDFIVEVAYKSVENQISFHLYVLCMLYKCLPFLLAVQRAHPA